MNILDIALGRRKEEQVETVETPVQGVEIESDEVTTNKQAKQESPQPQKQEQQETKIDDDIIWFVEKYGKVFVADNNNQSMIINLLYGILIELKKLNDKAEKEIN